MKRIGLVVAYDGTNYCGWQTQPNGITVQGVLNETLSELLGEKIETIGASRTDAGVHAMGNVAVFDTNTRIPGEKISYALNQRLPEDIRIQLSEEVEPDFHPRYCDSEKTYEYRILNRKFPVPTDINQKIQSPSVSVPVPEQSGLPFRGCRLPELSLLSQADTVRFLLRSEFRR